MKKVIFSAIVLFAIAVSVSSCKSQERCEAYSTKNTVKVNNPSY